MQCPFVYADGHRCAGDVYRVCAYGKHRYGIVRREDIRKVRLWCSEKGDHAGAVSSQSSKERMEFYPEDLEQMGILKEALAMSDNVPAETQAA